jgi:magnesium chelatase family protein
MPTVTSTSAPKNPKNKQAQTTKIPQTAHQAHPVNALTYSRVQIGIEALEVTIETHLSRGLPTFHLIGLPEKGVRESKERVRSALQSAGFKFPDGRVTVNLAPANLPKYDSHLDLAIALSIITASRQLIADLSHHEVYGELSLSGSLRPVRHVLASAQACHAAKRTMIIPNQNGSEAALIDDLKAFVAPSLLSVCAHLTKQSPLLPATAIERLKSNVMDVQAPTLDDVMGQELAKKALILACAGHHHLLLRGTPGVGKSLLAQCGRRLLPPLNHTQQITVKCLHDLHHIEHQAPFPPFRQPHHSASYAALVGGGQPILPGEISLAHHGVLCLDEIAEFKPSTLNALREPLENACVHLARAGQRIAFPSDFLLIATANPCPCGYYGQPRCQCSQQQVSRHQQRLSGPLLDRIDLVVDMVPPSLGAASALRTHSAAQENIQLARRRQMQRQQCLNGKIKQHCWHAEWLTKSAKNYLQAISQQNQFSLRRVQRLLRVARTIADCARSEKTNTEHIQEALAFQPT